MTYPTYHNNTNDLPPQISKQPTSSHPQQHHQQYQYQHLKHQQHQQHQRDYYYVNTNYHRRPQEQQQLLQQVAPIPSRSAGTRSIAVTQSHQVPSALPIPHHQHQYYSKRQQPQQQPQPLHHHRVSRLNTEFYESQQQQHQNQQNQQNGFSKHQPRRSNRIYLDLPPPPPPSLVQPIHHEQPPQQQQQQSHELIYNNNNNNNNNNSNNKNNNDNTNNSSNNRRALLISKTYEHMPPQQQYQQQSTTNRNIRNRYNTNTNQQPPQPQPPPPHQQQRINNHPFRPNSPQYSPSNLERQESSPIFIGGMTKEMFIDVLTCYINNLIERNEKNQLLETSPSNSNSKLEDIDVNNNNNNSNEHKTENNNSLTSPTNKIKKLHQDTNNPSPTSIIGISSPCSSSSSASSSATTNVENSTSNNNNNCNKQLGLLPNHLQPESVFFSVTKPSIPTFAYISRIVSYTQCSPSVFIVMIIYLQRIGNINKRLKVTNYNLHRLLVTSLMLACKWVDDITYTMQHYGKIGGIPTSKEMERLELQFLKYLNFNMHVPVEDYYTMQHDLDSLALNIM